MDEKEKKPRPGTLSQLIKKPATGSREVAPEMRALCRQAAAEGIVLLENRGGVLPLRDKKVSVFGRVQADYFYVGYGSGGDVNAAYTVSLLAGLRTCEGIEVNEALAARYEAWCAANRPSEGFWGHWPRYYKEMPISADVVQAAAQQSDVAIVVLGRAAGEDRENVLEKGSYYLTDEETALLDSVTAAFASVVVVLDCGNIMDLSWLEGYGDAISAVLYAWQGGMESGNAVADVLCGAVPPSGHLTDTIARRYSDYPSSAHFLGKRFNNYAEDIFVGYRYFETFTREAVLYPFGYGLGYTSFGLEVLSFACDGEEVRLQIQVTNTGGSHTGKAVAQVYYGAPAGRLGKPARCLAAFAKTGLLAPGGCETLDIRFPVASLASYDDRESFAWLLEAGEYVFYVGQNVRDAAPVGSWTLENDRIIEQLEQAAAVRPGDGFARLVCRTGPDGALHKAYEPVPESRVDLRERILASLPPEIPFTGDRGYTLGQVKSGEVRLDDFIAQLPPEELEALTRGDIVMNSPLGAPGNAGVLGGVSEALRARGVPPATTTDGPSGIRLACYASLLPCGTALASGWNVALLEALAAQHGAEMREKGSDMLLAPGMNIHRDPLCGRNFEYYSEDPLLTGKMAAAHVRGLQSNGVSACPKHFACNNQETGRTKSDSRVSERALREIYLKGFELCVREAQPMNIMTAYNKVNGVWAHYHYELCTTILRGQWGYAGNIITDWWMQPATDPLFPALANNAYRVRAGVDVLMPGAAGHLRKSGDDSLLKSYASEGGITLGEMQQAARHVLRYLLQGKNPTK